MVPSATPNNRQSGDMDRPSVEPSTPVFLPEVATITAMRRLSERDMLLTIDINRPGGLGHRPGQFVEVTAFGVGEAPISISSPPTQTKNFELCIRNVGSVTAALHTLKPGAQIGVRGPYGNGCDMASLKGRDLLFVAGGLGLAPLRSMIKTVLHDDHRADFGRITILCGAKRTTEVLFADELQQWRARKDVDCEITVDAGDSSWQGRVGVITTLLPRLKGTDLRNTTAVVCGPPVMYKFVVTALLEQGIPDDRIILALERLMKCGVGKCGHCQVDNLYVCKDGPVFTYAQVKSLPESIR